MDGIPQAFRNPVLQLVHAAVRIFTGTAESSFYYVDAVSNVYSGTLLSQQTVLTIFQGVFLETS